MTTNQWNVTENIEECEESRSSDFDVDRTRQDSRTPSCGEMETKYKFRRLDILAERVQRRKKEAEELFTKIQQGEDCREYDEVIIDQLQQSIDTFVHELRDLSRNEEFRSFIEGEDYTTTQMDAEDLLVAVKRTYANAMKKEKTQSLSHNSNITSRLPKIELPKFNGNKLKWYEFWGRFKSSIDGRKDLPNIDKLDYLVGLLEGEAKEAIQGLDITESNYAVALGILNDLFGKPDLIIDAHYEALDNITPAKDDPKEYRKVLNELERHLKVLQTLGEDVNKNNHIRHMLRKKFPQSLRYELNMAMRKKENNVKNIRESLAEIIVAKEGTHDTQEKGSTVIEKSFTTETLLATSSPQKRPGSNDQKGRWNKKPKPNQSCQAPKWSDKSGKRTASTQLFSQGKSTGPPNKKRRCLRCTFCEGDHYPDQCESFPTVDERKSKLKGKCFICFGNHMMSDCPNSSRVCCHCKRSKHHRSLCYKRFPRNKDQSNKEGEQKTVTALSHGQSNTVLQTAVAQIRNPKTADVSSCRLLFDTGSQKSYVTTDVFKKLKLSPFEENSLTVYTFGQPKPKTIDSELVCIDVETIQEGKLQIMAYVVPTITGIIPSFSCLKEDIRRSSPDLVMAADNKQDSKADILIGNDHYHSFFTGSRKHVRDNLYLVESKLGWIVSGCQYHKNREILSVLTYVQTGRCKDDGRLFTLPDPPLQDDSIKDIWELESIGIRDSPKILEEDEIIKFFNDTTIFQDSRYQVKWPWVQYPTDLPVNYGMALGRLAGLINRLDSTTLIQYDQVLKDQLKKGIIEIVTESKLPVNHAVHYLPHHCVIQPHKTTKLRIVYDASAKSKGKCSLNDYLFKGPLMLEDLVSLVLGFRNHTIGITADIEKAFLQVGLQSDVRDVTRFLWMKDINKGVTEDNIVHMRFSRVPFGVISSPYLLAATIRHHLTKKHSAMADKLAKCLYVDNLVTGVSSVEEGSELYLTAVEAFSELSMNIRDWVTNSSQLRERIPLKNRCEPSSPSTVLGLKWNVREDTLRLKVDPETFIRTASSKREILRIVASVFDPCGFVAPLVLSARIFLQLLWTERYKWDTPLTEDKIAEWENCAKPLRFIKDVEVPRHYFESMTSDDARKNDLPVELHCFSDASKDAYSSVVYVRRFSRDLKPTTNLVMSRTRLTPIRLRENMTTPKLELLGVLIGARLVTYIKQVLQLDNVAIYLWSDSQVVLGWLKSEKLLQPFVSRRIAEIKSYTSIQFRYVCSQDNPADIATKPFCGTLPQQWFKGPRFLQHPEKDWPPTANFLQAFDSVLSCPTLGQPSTPDAIARDENTESDDCIPSTTDHEDAAMIPSIKTDQIRTVQHLSFPKELEGHPTHLKKSLNLFVDEQGLLRCTGRLQNAALPYDQKFPILLPTNNPLTRRVILQCHVNNHHIGANHTLTLLRRRFWVPQGKSQVKKALNKCARCVKYGGGPYRLPPMPPLPPERVKMCYPFLYTGLDYLGPLTTVHGDTTAKRWCCIFTCMASRAVHLEIVNNSSADEFLLCLRRFVAANGVPALLVSDNALQFKLAAEIVQSSFCRDNKIAWHFIPELTPWHGGFYERLVGLIKHCLRRTLDKILLSDSQLITIIKEIGSVLNSRPLTAVDGSLDHILTPADFLSSCSTHLMEATTDAEIPTTITATKSDLIAGWKQGHQALEEFRSMFKDCYLTSLRERALAPHRQPRVLAKKDPEVGDIVQVWDDRSKNMNRAHWKVGKIEAFVPSTDGLKRTARVTLDSGVTLTRSIAHLYPLELPPDSSRQDAHRSPVPHTEEQTGDPSRQPAPADLPPLEKLRASGSPQPDANHCSQLNTSERPRRGSAVIARQLIRQWTQSLVSLSSASAQD